ncbi:hypothetical protein B0H19DRAFT_1061639 [Mycena capillaripes]|nr:hypothetical protein B0H19DRAFT_1061639 [Mycena capillaripes]
MNQLLSFVTFNSQSLILVEWRGFRCLDERKSHNAELPRQPGASCSAATSLVGCLSVPAYEQVRRRYIRTAEAAAPTTNCICVPPQPRVTAGNKPALRREPIGAGARQRDGMQTAGATRARGKRWEPASRTGNKISRPEESGKQGDTRWTPSSTTSSPMPATLIGCHGILTQKLLIHRGGSLARDRDVSLRQGIVASTQWKLKCFSAFKPKLFPFKPGSILFFSSSSIVLQSTTQSIPQVCELHRNATTLASWLANTPVLRWQPARQGGFDIRILIDGEMVWRQLMGIAQWGLPVMPPSAINFAVPAAGAAHALASSPRWSSGPQPGVHAHAYPACDMLDRSTDWLATRESGVGTRIPEARRDVVYACRFPALISSHHDLCSAHTACRAAQPAPVALAYFSHLNISLRASAMTVGSWHLIRVGPTLAMAFAMALHIRSKIADVAEHFVLLFCYTFCVQIAATLCELHTRVDAPVIH